MTRAENYEILGKSPMQAKYALNASVAEEFDVNGDLEILEFEDGSRLNVQTWTVANA